MADDPRWYLPGLTNTAGIAQLGTADPRTRYSAVHQIRGYADALDVTKPSSAKILAPFDGMDGAGTDGFDGAGSTSRQPFANAGQVAAEVVRLRAAADAIEAFGVAPWGV